MTVLLANSQVEHCDQRERGASAFSPFHVLAYVGEFCVC